MKRYGLMGLIFICCSVGANCSETDFRMEKKDLSQDTQLPVFRNQTAVKSRSVETAGRLESALMFGKTLNDAFFDNYPLSLHLNYHLNERHGVQFEYNSYLASQNSFVEAVRDKRGGFNLDQVPELQSQISLLWEYTPYYGKISFSKNTVYNLAIYTIAGAGKLQFSDGSSNVLQFGFGEKLYFSKNWGIKLDLRAKFYEFADFLRKASGDGVADPPFDQVAVFNTELSLGLIYLF